MATAGQHRIELVEIDGPGRTAVVRNNEETSTTRIDFDMAHVVPPQSAPDWITGGPLADPDSPFGCVGVDKYTKQHTHHPHVFAHGDAASTPNSKTGAAIRKQAPVVVENLRAVMAGNAPQAQYDGYASCTLTTARDMGLMKRRGLPFLYWNLMVKGRA